MEDKVTKAIRQVELAWKKWNDSAVKEDEKEVIRQTIQKRMDGLLKAYSLDWKTGKLSLKGQQGQPTGTASQAEQPKTEQPKQAGSWSTKELAEYLSKLFGKPLTAKNLRRHLRTMDEYNDGKVTHYSWNGQNDPMVKKVVESMKGKKAG